MPNARALWFSLWVVVHPQPSRRRQPGRALAVLTACAALSLAGLGCSDSPSASGAADSGPWQQDAGATASAHAHADAHDMMPRAADSVSHDEPDASAERADRAEGKAAMSADAGAATPDANGRLTRRTSPR